MIVLDMMRFSVGQRKRISHKKAQETRVVGHVAEGGRDGDVHVLEQITEVA
jgi:hypothetical protein